jgi:hypothetical protein
VKDHANLAPLGNAHLLERAINSGFSGSFLRRQ